MAMVEIYTTDYCPNCTRAKALLEQMGVAFSEVDLTVHPEKMAELQARLPGVSETPQIFVDGQGIGGCEEVHTLHAEGKLKPLLNLS